MPAGKFSTAQQDLELRDSITGKDHVHVSTASSTFCQQQQQLADRLRISIYRII